MHFRNLFLLCRATIVIKCDMDFVLYPLDVQTCPVDFSSCKYNFYTISSSFDLSANHICFVCFHLTIDPDKYSSKDMSFRWKSDNPITFPKDFDEVGFFRLPKYVVSFATQKEPHILHFNDVEHWSARLEIILSREVKSYLLENYLPSTLFVSMSWGSFVVVPEIVPGRMVRDETGIFVQNSIKKPTSC